MLLKVIRYEGPPLDYHVCVDEFGTERRIDLFVYGGFHGQDIKPEDLVGKTVNVERLHAYVEIAINVTIVKEKQNE